jgi:replication-associated recombination protein RarA
MDLRTAKGHDFYEAASAMQKAIRRGDAKLAGYFALDIFHGGYWKYVWKRLLTISAEDCAGVITKEIEALYNGYLLVNEGRKKSEKPKGRIFISKAVILLSQAMKSRDADHLQCLIYDRSKISDQEAEELINSVQDEKQEIPEYAFDVHTRRGKQMGKTKKQFFIEEQDALEPKQLGLFDDAVDELR